MDSLLGKHWHYLPADEVIDILDSDKVKGLDLFEVEHRRKHFGANSITGKKGNGPFLRFLLQFHQPLIYILIAAGAVTAFLQELVDAVVIVGVVLINAVIGFIQESKAVKAIEALARTVTTEATVVRAGTMRPSIAGHTDSMLNMNRIQALPRTFFCPWQHCGRLI